MPDNLFLLDASLIAHNRRMVAPLYLINYEFYLSHYFLVSCSYLPLRFVFPMAMLSYLAFVKIFPRTGLPRLESSCGHGTKAVIQTHKSINE